MAVAMVTGRLFRKPERKTSQAGKSFVTEKVREGQGDATAWWSIVAFGSIAEELAELKEGETVSVSGHLVVETYRASDGEIRVTLKLTADAILAARRKRREKRPDAPSEDHSSERRSYSDMNDDISL